MDRSTADIIVFLDREIAKAEQRVLDFVSARTTAYREGELDALRTAVAFVAGYVGIAPRPVERTDTDRARLVEALTRS